MDHQIQTFTNVDNKAAKTFRLDAILLGFILTAVSFVTRIESLAIDPYVNPFTIFAVVALIVSFIFAVLTYMATEIDTGTGPDGIQRLIDKRYTETEWLILLLRSEKEWMRENERQLSSNTFYLVVSHVALILAVVVASVGIVWANLSI